MQGSQKPKSPQRGRTASVKGAPNRRPWLKFVGLAVVLTLSLVGGGGLYAAHLEDDNQFCTTCHTQPETTFFERSQAPVATDLASYHNKKHQTCITCHSGEGVGGRIAAISLGVRDLGFYMLGQYQSPATLTNHIPDTNCLKCHQQVVTKADFNNHFHRFLSRWQRLQKQAATCVDCHQSHTTGGAELFLPVTQTQAVCQRCHRVMGDD